MIAVLLIILLIVLIIITLLLWHNNNTTSVSARRAGPAQPGLQLMLQAGQLAKLAWPGCHAAIGRVACTFIGLRARKGPWVRFLVVILKIL